MPPNAPPTLLNRRLLRPSSHLQSVPDYQCGGLVQNFSGGLFSRRMGAPVSQTNAAGGSVQYSWGSGGRCKPVWDLVCKKISVQKKNLLWGAPNCGGPGAAAPFAPLLIRHCLQCTSPAVRVTCSARHMQCTSPGDSSDTNTDTGQRERDIFLS